MARCLRFDASNPAEAVGRPVWGNNIRQVGVVVDYAPPTVRGAVPMFCVRWTSGKIEWRPPGELGDLEHDIEAAQARLTALQSARERALRA